MARQGCPHRLFSLSSGDRLFPQELNILYDSKCNVCKLEIDFLKRRDQRLNSPQCKLKFTDLESPLYDPRCHQNGGIEYETGMKAMHGILPDGTVIKGVPVFDVAYQHVGLGWLFAASRVPVLKWVLDRLYDVFAKYRTMLTRQQTIPELVRAYQHKRNLQEQQTLQADDCDACQQEKASMN